MAIPLPFLLQALGKVGSTVFGMAAQDQAMLAESDANFLNRQEVTRAEGASRANAADVLAQGAIAAGQARLGASQLQARQSVAYTASGVDAGQGTAAQVVDFTGFMGEAQARAAKNDALRAALGHQEMARKYRITRRQLENEQQARQDGHFLRQLSTFLGGSGDVASTIASGAYQAEKDARNR